MTAAPLDVSAGDAVAAVNVAIALISALTGALASHVAQKIQDAERARRLRENSRKLELQERRMAFLLQQLGNVFSHLGMSARYSDELYKLLMLNDEQGGDDAAIESSSKGS